MTYPRLPWLDDNHSMQVPSGARWWLMRSVATAAAPAIEHPRQRLNGIAFSDVKTASVSPMSKNTAFRSERCTAQHTPRAARLVPKAAGRSCSGATRRPA
jgi:hypothetical protein